MMSIAFLIIICGNSARYLSYMLLDRYATLGCTIIALCPLPAVIAGITCGMYWMKIGTAAAAIVSMAVMAAWAQVPYYRRMLPILGKTIIDLRTT